MEIIERVVEKLTPLRKKEVELYLNSDQDAESLGDNLEKIQLLLEDAERRRLREPHVRRWLEEVQDFAYDIEDALDDWEAANRPAQQDLVNGGEEEQRKKKNQIISPNNNFNFSMVKPYFWEKVCLFLHSPCSLFNKRRPPVSLDIKDLNEKIEYMYEEGANQLKLKNNSTGSKGRSKCLLRSVTTSGYTKSEIKGRENDKRNLRNILIMDYDRNIDPIGVVCVVGKRGLGKTTLAQMVYDDDVVRHEFDVRMWVCVSDRFKVFEIARNILEQLGGDCQDIVSFSPEALMQRVKDSLGGKKFLLVLDDVWTEENEDWERLKSCLCGGGRGSKVLVTTRKVNSANAMGSSGANIYQLQGMEDEECWLIISQIVFSSGSVNEGDYDRRGLEEIGRRIAEKCDGLPLAARIFGGFLKNKERNVRDWEGVLESKIWQQKNLG